MSRADDPRGLGDFHEGPAGQELGQTPRGEGVLVSQWAWGRGKDPMRVLQGKRGSGGVSIRETQQERLSTGQELGGPHWV